MMWCHWVVLVLAISGFSVPLHAETLTLESGEQVIGKILRKEGDTIVVEVNGTPRVIRMSDIADIKEMRESDFNTEPMYGGRTNTATEQAIDNKYIANMTQHGSREDASRGVMQLGWSAFDQGDLRTAMRSFVSVRGR